MDQNSVEKELLKERSIQHFSKEIAENKSLIVERLWEGPKALLLHLAQTSSKKHLLIFCGEKPDNQLFEDLAFFSGRKPIDFPAWETLPGEENLPTSDTVGERFSALEKIVDSRGKNEKLILIAPLKAAFEKVVSPRALKELFLTLSTQEQIPFNLLVEKLSLMGYHRVAVAAEKGTFAVRGGIIDLFPASLIEPYRIEFADDEILSIRKYDPASQRTTGKVDKIIITPSDEFRFLAGKNREGTLLDYLEDDVIIVFDDLFALEEQFVTLGLGKEHPRFLTKESFFQLTSNLQKLFFVEGELDKLTEIKIIERAGYSGAGRGSFISFDAFGENFKALQFRHPFTPLLAAFCPPQIPLESFTQEEMVKEIVKEPREIHVIISGESEKSYIDSQLASLEVKATLHFFSGYLSSGFFLPESNFALLTGPELTGRFHLRREKLRSYSHALPLELLSLNAGETVVHMGSGIGRFLGIEKRKNHLGVDTEFLHLEYADGAKLYVPIEQAHLVSKYIGATTELPTLHTLGSTRWKTSLERSERAILIYAEELIQLEAKRAVRQGFSFPEEGALTHQFADEFPYEETPDQMTAINNVYSDMKSTKSMDRLVLGDVGYGKTEVAMRAAFKAVVDGDKQVALLVPTTVLAMQHFDTFSERMKGFPIKIAVLSRFRPPKEVKNSIEETEKGIVNILIGTHRLISGDIIFRDLGLIIIDEEQRFGVKAKEHLKKIKAEVDCLTLSATPIPRTLYLSLVGARDMSVINTPPLDRLPIQTMIAEATDEVLKNSLLKELMRGGQAFVVHNRIESIYELANRIRTLLPEAKIAVGHGQMSSNELDTIFHAFKSGKADILVSTSIIENGIDIPNANTILIDKADHFGLADLYQMRGRVGRWNRKAFCYFLVHNVRNLSDLSKRRLAAIASAPGYGGGMQIALHDLEIRGAGNILGTEQSGHITSIGFTLYCKLLKKAINQLKKKGVPLILTDVKIDFPFDARLPDDYVSEVHLRLELYQRLGDLESDEEIDEFKKELEDRFGPPPAQVEWLLALSKLRLFVAKNRFTLIKMSKNILEAEQAIAPKKKIVKKVLITPIKTPAELLARLPIILRENFPLPE